MEFSGGWALYEWFILLLECTPRNILCILEPLDGGQQPLIQWILECWQLFADGISGVHVPNNDNWFPLHNVQVYYDFGYGDEAKEEVAKILACQHDGQSLHKLAKWSSGNSTWEPHKSCDKLPTMDGYLSIQGVSRSSQLPQHKNED